LKGKSLTPLVLALVWLASLGAVFVLGMLLAFAFHLKPGAGYNGTSGGDPAARELEVFIQQLSGAPLDRAQLNDGSVEGLGGQFRDAFRSLLEINDPVERLYKSRVLVAALPTRRMLFGVREIDAFPPSPARDELLMTLLQEWGKRDGRSAMLFAAGNRGNWNREAVIGAVLIGWSKVNPGEAADWVKRNPAGDAIDGERMGEIVWTLATRSIAEALTAVVNIDKPAVRARAAMSLTDFLLQSGNLDRAAAWLEDLPDDAAKSQALAYTASRWAGYDPERALAWSSLLAEPYRIPASLAALETWSASEPEAAFAWCLTSDQDRLRRTGMTEVATRWVEMYGPAPLAEFLNRHPYDPAFDGPVAIIALESMNSDVETALRWAQSISDPARRSATEAVIAQFIGATTPAAEPPEPVLATAPEPVPATYAAASPATTEPPTPEEETQIPEESPPDDEELLPDEFEDEFLDAELLDPEEL